MLPSSSLLGLLTLLSIVGSLVLAEPNTQDLTSIDLQHSRTYSSPLAEGSQASYATDNDFQRNKPTCLMTNSELADEDGYHWLLIDLGVQYKNLVQIRITPNPSKTDFTKEVADIDVYVAKKLQIEEGAARVPWEQQDMTLCGNSGEAKTFMTVAMINCAQAMQGRWIALRRRPGRLNFCMVEIYVKDAHSDFFRPVVNAAASESAHGIVFRLGKYLNHGQCRIECLKNVDCQALMFTPGSYGGTCQLVRNFGFSSNELRRPRLECRSNKCKIEEAIPHRGLLVELKRGEDESSPRLMTLGEDEQQVVEIVPTDQTWQLHKPEGASLPSPNYLFSVQLQGVLQGLGRLDLLSVDENQVETFCSSIDPLETSMLQKTTIFCQQTAISPVSLKLQWTGDLDQPVTFNVTGGSVRLTATPPASSEETGNTSTTTSSPTTSSPTTTTTSTTTTTTTSSSTTTTTTGTTTSMPPTSAKTTTRRSFFSSTAATAAIPADHGSGRNDTKKIWRRQENYTPGGESVMNTTTPEASAASYNKQFWSFNGKDVGPKSTFFWMVVVASLCGCLALIACIGVISWKCSRKSTYTFEPK